MLNGEERRRFHSTFNIQNSTFNIEHSTSNIRRPLQHEMLTFLLLVTATFHPARPTVGDPITVDFARPVVLDRAPAYEIVSQRGSRAVVRTFEPKPFALSGTTDGVHFRNLVVPVRSVLAPNDALQPAPLKPPRKLPMPRGPFVAIGAAALLAIAAWAGLYALHIREKRRARGVLPIPPAERFRAAVSGLIARRPAQPWAELADAVRSYLDERGFGAELTTSQLLASLGGHELIAEILRRGDLEKFSPWGAPPGDFRTVALRAFALPDEFEPAPASEVAA
jgi:hypothetical protein